MATDTEKKFRVGGHTFLTRMSGELHALVAPSMHPFEVEEEGESPVFTFTCTDGGPQEVPAGHLGTYDCGGCQHKVGYNTEGGYRIDIHDAGGTHCGALHTDHDGKEATLYLTATEDAGRRFAIRNALMITYAFATADKDTALMHASVVSLGGKGYVMTAPSGTGKSTHTALWQKCFEGCELVNDDNPIIRIIDGKPMVYGSPWSGKLPCYRNVSHPVGAFVRIYQENWNNIHPLRPLEAYTALLSAVSCMVWDRRMQTGVSATVAAMVEGSRVFRLGCRPNEAAARLCMKATTKKA